MEAGKCLYLQVIFRSVLICGTTPTNVRDFNMLAGVEVSAGCAAPTPAQG
jgi:hypothetical protein